MGWTTNLMQRGEIIWADFDPVRGSEAAKRRPVVIVSNDLSNRTVARLGRGAVTVVPLTSRVDRVYSFQVLLPPERTGLRVDSLAQPDHIRSLSVTRFGATIGHVPPDLMAEIDDAIRIHLNL